MGVVLVSTYLVGWVVVFGSFVFFYHRNKAMASSKLEPWFSQNEKKDLYITLLQAMPPVDESLLKAALLNRAVGVVERVLKLREQKPALSQLLKSGSIGEEVWNSFSLAETELEEEVVEVMHEADTFNQGWGQTIYQSASEIYGHIRQRSDQIEVERLRVTEREANKKIVQWKEELDNAIAKQNLPKSDNASTGIKNRKN